MGQKERGGLGVFLILWCGEPFCRWKGRSLSVCFLALHGWKDSHNALWAGSTEGLSDHHGASSAFLLTSMTRLWYTRLEDGGCTSVEVEPQRTTW